MKKFFVLLCLGVFYFAGSAMGAPSSRSDFYARGVRSYQAGDYAMAVAYWKKAERGASSKLLTAIDEGIRRVYEKNGTQYTVSWWTQVKRILWRIPLLLAQLLVLLGIVIAFLTRGGRRWWHRLVWLMVAGGFLITEDRHEGVVRETCPVRAGPGENYAVIREVSPLELVTIEDKEDTWYKIRHSKKMRGWVEGKMLAVVEDPSRV